MRDAAAGVLVVDDNPAKRTALVAAIAPLGLEVVECDSGRAALRALLGREFAVVLLDINMPDMNGYEVAEHLRARPKNAHTPILYITAERETEIDRLRGYATGAVDFILAPVVPEVLRSKILVFVDLYRMRREALEMTERLQESRAALEGRTAELVEANRELESFSYSVSHDLRSPLRAVDGYARIVEEDYAEKLDDEGRRLLGVIRDNSKKMGELIDDLLEFSRLGRKPLSTAAIDMTRLVEEVLGELQMSGERPPGLMIGALPPARGDATLVKQAWANLLGNAIKFSSKREQPAIEVSGHENGAESVYCVKDNGAGFDMQYYNKLFGVFQRLHSADEFAGTGVGLAIVQRVVTRQGGRVWAEGKVDEGAAFYFSLPRGRQDGQI